MDGYSSRASAERAVEDSTERHNAKERERAEEERHRRFPWQPRLYKPDTVDGKSGWVDWSGGIIIRVEELAVRE